MGRERQRGEVNLTLTTMVGRTVLLHKRSAGKGTMVSRAWALAVLAWERQHGHDKGERWFEKINKALEALGSNHACAMEPRHVRVAACTRGRAGGGEGSGWATGIEAMAR